jgi:hypothetical protein
MADSLLSHDSWWADFDMGGWSDPNLSQDEDTNRNVILMFGGPEFLHKWMNGPSADAPSIHLIASRLKKKLNFKPFKNDRSLSRLDQY